LGGIRVAAVPAEHSTTFENIYNAQGRVQYIHFVAPKLDFSFVPEEWRNAPIIHLAPVAQEVEPILPAGFHPSLVGLTLQGWLRTWDKDDRRVSPCSWDNAAAALGSAGAAVVSIQDVANDEDVIESFTLASRLLAVTEGAAGLRLYWNNDLRRIRPPKVTEVDPTGAGDIFAAAFFARLYATRDPWEAARFASRLGAISVTRQGLAGIPTPQEVQECLTEVINK
jgi:sugar/nucleoside kinase (ribokinase family)